MESALIPHFFDLIFLTDSLPESAPTVHLLTKCDMAVEPTQTHTRLHQHMTSTSTTQERALIQKP
jgi:hypothetical protein